MYIYSGVTWTLLSSYRHHTQEVKKGTPLMAAGGATQDHATGFVNIAYQGPVYLSHPSVDHHYARVFVWTWLDPVRNPLWPVSFIWFWG